MEVNEMAIRDYLARLEGINNDFYFEGLAEIPAPPELLSKVASQAWPETCTPPIAKGVLNSIALIQVEQISV